jgi:hypothetical protein
MLSYSFSALLLRHVSLCLLSPADVIITKAGPGTISEALICGLPMVLNAFVPCQEEGNIPYVTENKVTGWACMRVCDVWGSGTKQDKAVVASMVCL